MADREKFELEPEEPANGGGGNGRSGEKAVGQQDAPPTPALPVAIEDIPDGGLQLARTDAWRALRRQGHLQRRGNGDDLPFQDPQGSPRRERRVRDPPHA